jgi:hypothetical protein
MTKGKPKGKGKQPRQKNGPVEVSRLPFVTCTTCRRTIPIPRGSTATETLTAHYEERHPTGRNTP